MKTVLYLGTDPSHFKTQGRLIHYPVIQIVPKSLQEVAFAFAQFNAFTHLIFTSKNAVGIFCSHLKILQISCQSKIIIAVGQVTKECLHTEGLVVHHVAPTETQEGVVELLNSLCLDGAYVFLPRSSLSRSVLTQYLTQRNIRHLACDLYDTVTQKRGARPDFGEVDEIVFTSPSTVRAFLEIFGKMPAGKKLRAIGPVTKKTLTECDK